DRGARHTDFRQAGADRVLPGDEACAASRATLLPVPIGEDRAFLGEAVDVEGLVAHHPVAVAADVPVSDVVSPNDEDVWLVRVRHMTLLGFGFLVSNCPLCQKSPLFEP